MMNEGKNVPKDKSFRFAVRIDRLFQHLTERRKEYVLSKQLLRSGMSIRAIVREACNASSKQDFIYKLSIAQKESDETLYWLELLKEANILTDEEFNSIYSDYSDGNELLKMIRSSILTAKSNLEKAKGRGAKFHHSSFIVIPSC